ncbi:restriction endonuclease [Thiovibrio sp. JS02]
MAQQQNTKDVIYSWVDENGKTHYSNYKVLPGKADKSSQDLPTGAAKEGKTVKAQVQPVKPDGMMKPKNIFSALSPALGFIVLLAILKLILDKWMDEKKRKGRSLKKYNGPDAREATINNNYYHQHNYYYGSERQEGPQPNKEWSQAIVEKIAEVSKLITHEPKITDDPPSWSLKFIQEIEWREFEKLCAKIIEEKGFVAKVGDVGPDGGIDIHIYEQDDQEKLYGIAQCKAQKQDIKIDVVKAFRWTMNANQADKGFFFTSGKFSKPARRFGEEEGIEMLTGEDLLRTIKGLPEEKQKSILKEIANTDYKTPLCVRCGIKMARRSNPKNGDEFWGCVNFPNCRNIIQISKR